jgi:hypothetical protein
VTLARRRFTALAVACLSLWRVRAAAAADLPDCTITQDLDGWKLGAWYGEKASGASYSLTRRKGTIPLPNRNDMLTITTFDLTYDPDAGEFGFSCEADWPDGMKAADPVTYQIVNAGATLVSFTLSPDQSSQQIHIGEATIDRFARGDSVVKVGLGGQNYELAVSAQSFHQAMVTAQALAKRVKADHDRKACAELSGSSCVLTTVACHAVGLPDDCFELRTMRRLRDRWIVQQDFGPAALHWYYAISPAILRALPAPAVSDVFRRFYASHVVPAVLAERIGLHAWAYRWLKSGVEKLAARHTGLSADAADASP